MKKTVLLTGAAGFIGSHFAEAYLKAGYRVIGIDDFSTGCWKNLSECKGHPDFVMHTVDITDRDAVQTVMAAERPHIINHQAAQRSVPASVEDPHYDAKVNIIGLLNLLMACKDYPIEHFIFASTGGALAPAPDGERIPDENDKPQMLSPYAITKFASENYIAAYAGLFGFAHTSLRYANVYGPRQVPAGESGVVPIFVENALAGLPSVLYAYDDMPDGCTRDYVHVFDVVAAGMLATEKPANTVLNISTGVELTMAHIYRVLMDVMGLDLPLQRKGPRIGDIRRSVISNARARDMLGWTPKITLQDGLAMLVKK
jgi:UDP-glucose 4-epimerase